MARGAPALRLAPCAVPHGRPGPTGPRASRPGETNLLRARVAPSSEPHAQRGDASNGSSLDGLLLWRPKAAPSWAGAGHGDPMEERGRAARDAAPERRAAPQAGASSTAAGERQQTGKPLPSRAGRTVHESARWGALTVPWARHTAATSAGPQPPRARAPSPPVVPDEPRVAHDPQGHRRTANGGMLGPEGGRAGPRPVVVGAHVAYRPALAKRRRDEPQAPEEAPAARAHLGVATAAAASKPPPGAGEVPLPRRYMPYHEWAVVHGATHKVQRAEGGARGQKVLLLAAPIMPPTGWFPRVHGLASERTELSKRALEATRMGGALAPHSVAGLLDTEWDAICAWPRAKAIGAMLDALCALAGHSRMAAWRQHLCGLDQLLVSEYGMPRNSVMHAAVGASILQDYLRGRDEACELRKRAAAARAHAGLASPQAGEDADAESGATNGSAACALSALTGAGAAMHLRLSTGHALLNQYRRRLPTREDGGAVPPEPLLPAHLELGAATPWHGEIVQGCFAMCAAIADFCVRRALGTRSRTPDFAEGEMAVALAGCDLKKDLWALDGRPLICAARGSSGTDEWLHVLRRVLQSGGFNAKAKSWLRAHDGPGGDPRHAKRWLDREQTEAEANTMLQALCALDVAPPGTTAGSRAKVSPHLLRDESGKVPAYTMHSLKMWKPSLYLALLLHTDYVCEASAHAGSQLERLSLAAVQGQAKALRPAGLAVALRYARGARSQTVVEVDRLAFSCMRAWLATAGLAAVPRTGGWTALARWASACAAGGEMARQEGAHAPLALG